MKSLDQAQIGVEYVVIEVHTEDEEMKAFLFTLGCYSGQPITVVSRKKKNLVISIKDSRYNIDQELAKSILI
ncbi:MAG: ferrous iron transport protein A [Firmicutes bacterium]|nr:ferrous iron transport protein A [Bacillota bacterium]